MELAEAVVTLLDSCWFERQIFGKEIVPSRGPIVLDLDDQEIAEPSSGSRTTGISRFPSLLSRSMSSTASFFLDSPPPNSVFLSSQSHLHPVEPGKEISGEVVMFGSHQNRGSDYWRRRKAASKSLTELEFEELKGFMDLGFVFSEEDKDSTLASIIPGLQSLGKKVDREEKHEEDEQEEEEEETQTDEEELQESLQIVSIPRPYLSETWEWLDMTRKKEEALAPLVNWNFPALSNETDMKDNLRWWAHTVASAVR